MVVELTREIVQDGKTYGVGVVGDLLARFADPDNDAGPERVLFRPGFTGASAFEIPADAVREVDFDAPLGAGDFDLSDPTERELARLADPISEPAPIGPPGGDAERAIAALARYVSELEAVEADDDDVFGPELRRSRELLDKINDGEV